MTKVKQSLIGTGLAAAILAAWLTLHVYGVFAFRIRPTDGWEAALIIVAQTWLSAGLFIVAHDAMHGSLSPSALALNTWIGRLCLGVYAFFPYDTVAAKHHAHHRFSGHRGDPDFNADDPKAFWPWYRRFMLEYFGVWQFAAILALVIVYAVILHAKVANIILFWALPAIASSVQLFTFGTWLPHRHRQEDFCDRHNARTLEFGWLASLAACFHFGYHIEHHRSPGSPWWMLPKVRAGRQAAEAPV